MSIERNPSARDELDEYLRAPNPEQFGCLAHLADPVRRAELDRRTPYGVAEYYLEELDRVYGDRTFYLDQMANGFEGPTSAQPPKAIVAIPVAGHQEAANIDTALGLYRKQLLAKDLWELVLFVNSPKKDPDGSKISNQETMDEIERARAKYELPNLRVLEHQYDEPEPMGTIRGDLWDSIVFDLHARGAKDKVLVINNDIDVAGLREDYVGEMAFKHFINGWRFIRGPLRFAREPLAPTASKIINYYWSMYTASAKKQGGNAVVEANSGLDISTYCEIGGIDRSLEVNEFNELAERKRMLSKSRYTTIFADEHWHQQVPLKTSPRRQLAAIAMGNSVFNTWDTSKVPFTPFDELRIASPVHAAEHQASQNIDGYLLEIDEQYCADELAHESRSAREMISFRRAARKILGLPPEIGLAA